MKTLLAAVAGSIGVFAPLLLAQDQPVPPEASPTTPANATVAETPRAQPTDDEAIRRGVEIILAMQEGEAKAEWPYEGVYRVNGAIPIGYRIGGSAICAGALLSAPGYAEDAARKEAVARAAAFVISGTEQPLMNPDYDGGYDVRGWGYTYALEFLLRMKAANATPEAIAARADDTIRWYVRAIEQTEIPQAGGWNYARPAGKGKVAAPSPFMTAPTLLALFEAKRQGFEVDAGVVERAIRSLEAGRMESGGVTYAGAGEGKRDGVPGAVGRMMATETALFLAGRSTRANVRASLDAFITHWAWLDKRRAKPGTHQGPYAVAPYYFYYAHEQAARAIELLPRHERAEYRRRLRELLFSVRLPDGSWNDRVFARSASFGTAMAVLSLAQPSLPAPASWKP
ncbi:MAG: hypothetical protein ACKVW3_07855 [Phycisphaerales bacterium]